jgi:arsenate reductase (thioredoxin)
MAARRRAAQNLNRSNSDPHEPESPHKVLFLCTGNSARSIIAEHVLRVRGKGRFESYSAGAKPTGKVNPYAVEVLEKYFTIDAGKARSKSWEEYRDVTFDFVITVCDKAKESRPIWPGQPVIPHWGSPDPAILEGDHDKTLKHFVDVATQINSRIGIFTAFRDEQLNEWAVRNIGEQFVLSSSPQAATP